MSKQTLSLSGGSWAVAIKPPDVVWDETPIDLATLKFDEHGCASSSYAPTSNALSVLVGVVQAPDGQLPADLIGVVLAFGALHQHPSGFRQAALEFSSKYGALGIASSFRVVNSESIVGESIAVWSAESHAMWEALVLLQYLRLLKGPRKRAWFMPLVAMPAVAFEMAAKSSAARRPLVADEPEASREARAERAARAVEKSRAGALQDGARTRLLERVNEGLLGSGARLELQYADKRFQLINAAPRLLTRLWQRVALAATQRTQLLACENCGELLVPDGPRKREKMRSDRKTCGQRCRQALAAKRKPKPSGGQRGKAR